MNDASSKAGESSGKRAFSRILYVEEMSFEPALLKMKTERVEQPLHKEALEERFKVHVAEEELLGSGDTVVVALSGGLDSVVLLHLLRFELDELNLDLRAAHYDHAMRPCSKADANWVSGLCSAWNVALTSKRAEQKISSEEEARDARYSFFETVVPTDAKIATAHHKNDQAETVLFRVARGTGVRGLRGILPKRGNLIRPLLPFSRSELEEYAAERGISWREDPTNKKLIYSRNVIRHVQLPALEAEFPQAVDILARFARVAQSTHRRLNARAKEVAGELMLEEGERFSLISREKLLELPGDLQARVLRFLLHKLGSVPDRANTERMVEFARSAGSGAEIHLEDGARIERDFDRLRITNEDGEEHSTELRIQEQSAGEGQVVIEGDSFGFAWGDDRKSERDVRELAVISSPAFPITVRQWEPGDRIRFAYGSKKLKDFFREKKLDRHTRKSLPVVVDAKGEVLWVAGLVRAGDVSCEGDGFHIALLEE